MPVFPETEPSYVPWSVAGTAGLRERQTELVPLFQATKVFRVYSSTVVPGLLQTRGYIADLLASITRFRGIADEVDSAASARLERSKVLRNPDHRAEFVIEETVLRYRIGGTEAMAEQLRALAEAIDLPAVSLGVIPAVVDRRPMRPVPTFSLYDARLAFVEILSGNVTLTDPAEVDQYARAFEGFRRVAVYGEEARGLVGAAIDALG